MKHLRTGLCLAIWAARPPDAAAQTKLAATLECSAPTVQGAIEVGDRPGHSMFLTQRQCRWSPPLLIEGIAARESTLSLVTDSRGDGARDRGYHVIVFENGDRLFLHWFTESSGGNFALSGGTGRFLGIYGSGVLTARRMPDGKLAARFEGTYTLPQR